MKGKFYNPKVGDSHSKLLNPGQFKIKPWDQKEECIVYNWEGSIPEKWYSIKGRDHFKHSSEVTNIKSTLDFLKMTQQYIHNINIPKQYIQQIRRLPSRYSVNFSPASQIHTPPSEEIKLPKSKVQRPMTNSCSLPQKLNSVRPQLLENLKETYPVINQYTLPKALVTGRKPPKEQLGHHKFSSMKVKKFLRRFEEKFRDFEPVKIRRGVNGKMLKNPRRIKKEIPKATRKIVVQPPQPTSSIGQYLSEPYLEYLRWKQKNSS